jgi:hypothetical protein
MKNLIFALSIALVSIAACKKDEAVLTNNNATNAAIVKFDNRVGVQELVLNGQKYRNTLGDTFTVSAINYFVSNVKIRSTNGNWYVLPKDSSYFLVSEELSKSQQIRLPNLPVGKYNAIEFVVGVDSLKSVSPLAERTGALDPGAQAAGMYWAWNSGYIFFKIEGNALAAQAPYQFHIGGFGGYNTPTINNLRAINLDFGGDELIVSTNQTARPSSVHVVADILKLFDAKAQIDLDINKTVMFTPFSTNVADNYGQMFRVDHVENY